MAYTPPAANAVIFNFVAPYSPPSAGSIVFNFGGGGPGPPGLSLPRAASLARQADDDWMPMLRRRFAPVLAPAPPAAASRAFVFIIT